MTLTEYNLVNPYHVNHFNEFAFDFFDRDKLKKSAEEDNEIYFKKAFHRFHYLPEFAKKSDKKKDFYRRHYFNVVEKIDFALVVDKKPNSLDLSRPMYSEPKLLSRYDQIMAMRVKHDK